MTNMADILNPSSPLYSFDASQWPGVPVIGTCIVPSAESPAATCRAKMCAIGRTCDIVWTVPLGGILCVGNMRQDRRLLGSSNLRKSALNTQIRKGNLCW